MHDIKVNITEEPVELTVTPPQDCTVTVEESLVNISIVEEPVALGITEVPFTIVFPDPNTIGPKGEKGDSGAILTAVAGEVLGSSRLVVKSPVDAKLYYADINNIDHAYGVYGITRTAALADQPIEVYIAGEVEEVAWNWQPNNPVFMSIEGYLTQSTQQAEYFVTVGFAITPKKILLRIENPIFLIN